MNKKTYIFFVYPYLKIYNYKKELYEQIHIHLHLKLWIKVHNKIHNYYVYAWIVKIITFLKI